MSVAFRSINPKNNKLVKTYEAISSVELESKIDSAYNRYRWKHSKGHGDLSRRYQKLGFLKQILAENRTRYASLITQEMGKPIKQAEGEIDKSISHIDYYINNSTRFL